MLKVVSVVRSPVSWQFTFKFTVLWLVKNNLKKKQKQKHWTANLKTHKGNTDEDNQQRLSV